MNKTVFAYTDTLHIGSVDFRKKPRIINSLAAEMTISRKRETFTTSSRFLTFNEKVVT